MTTGTMSWLTDAAGLAREPIRHDLAGSASTERGGTLALLWVVSSAILGNPSGPVQQRDPNERAFRIAGPG